VWHWHGNAGGLVFECDEDKERFEDKLCKIATAKHDVPRARKKKRAAWMTSEDDNDRQEREQRAANRVVLQRARDARREFNKMLTRIWIGNGGGAVVTTNYIGTTHGNNLIALCFFLVGLVILSIMGTIYLIGEYKAIHSNQYATSLLHFKMDFFESPLERAKFTLRVIIPAATAAFCFAGGCIAGLIALI
jgi:hypothetical protein